jgi:hypothetical protein
MRACAFARVICAVAARPSSCRQTQRASGERATLLFDPGPGAVQEFESQREEIKNKSSEDYNVMKITLESNIGELEKKFGARILYCAGTLPAACLQNRCRSRSAA